MDRLTFISVVMMNFATLLYVNCNNNAENVKSNPNTFLGRKTVERNELQIRADDIFQSENGKGVKSVSNGRQQSERQIEVGMDPKSTKEIHRSFSGFKKRQSETTSPEERTRILVAPHWLPDRRRFLQLNIQTGVQRSYRYVTLSYVISFVYVSSQRKLLISLYRPDRIVSSDLDQYGTTNIIENIRANEMCVDEDSDIVFFTTSQPDRTIRRMNTQGENLGVLRTYTRMGNYPRAIAVNPTARTLYVSTNRRLYAVSYNGLVQQTIASGHQVYALTYDNSGNSLYYNDDHRVMNLDLSRNVTSEVISLEVVPWNFRLYDNTLYFSSSGRFNGIIGSVNLENRSVNNLMSVFMNRAIHFLICLLP